MILVLNVCKERLHCFEFVRPIEDILRKGGFDFESFHYKDEIDFEKYDKVIISGTSLRDNYFFEDIERFEWVKNFKGEIFGICAGFQILAKISGGELKKKKEIGFFKENFQNEFFGLKGEVEVYHLHENYFELSSDWEVYSSGDIAQAGKFKGREIYGVLFHPEVRNKNMIIKFCELPS